MTTQRATTQPRVTGGTEPGRLDGALTALTVAGFIVPNAMVVASGALGGLGPGGYFAAWLASIPSAQLLVDLALCSAAFLVWAVHDARQLGIRWWPIIPATFLVGLCFAIPLYLRSRGRRIAEIGAAAVVGDPLPGD